MVNTCLKPKCMEDFVARYASNYKELIYIFAFLGAIVASLGLVTNSVATVIGSMLLSPVGDVIIKGILQCFLSQYYDLGSETVKFLGIFSVERNFKPFNLNIGNLGTISIPNRWWWLEVITMMIIIVISSWIIGMIWIAIADPVDEESGNRNIQNSKPTDEMKARAKMENAIVMIPIAIVGGLALPFALRRDNTTTLVGISIATALLPPLANIGLALSYHTLGISFSEEDEEEYNIKEALGTGIVIFLINFVLLLVCAGIAMKIICRREYVETVTDAGTKAFKEVNAPKETIPINECKDPKNMGKWIEKTHPKVLPSNVKEILSKPEPVKPVKSFRHQLPKKSEQGWFSWMWGGTEPTNVLSDTDAEAISPLVDHSIVNPGIDTNVGTNINTNIEI